MTTSLRGLVNGRLTVEVLTEGAHSGQASGIVPSSFRLLRQLLDRLEDSATGDVLLPELHVEIPADRVVEARRTAAALDRAAADEFPFAGATRPMVADAAEQFLAQTWRPTVSYIGADGFPPTGRAGNVLRPSTTLTLSFRLPPTCDHVAALAAIEQRPPRRPAERGHRALRRRELGAGLERAAVRAVAAAALDEASTAAFGQPARTFGEGGTIPFMGMLGERFPAAQFVVTGALVPAATPTDPTSSSTCRRPAGSPSASPACSAPTPRSPAP